VTGDPARDIGEPSAGIDIIEVGGADQDVDCGGTFTATAGADSQIAGIAAIMRDRTARFEEVRDLKRALATAPVGDTGTKKPAG